MKINIICLKWLQLISLTTDCSRYLSSSMIECSYLFEGFVSKTTSPSCCCYALACRPDMAVTLQAFRAEYWYCNWGEAAQEISNPESSIIKSQQKKVLYHYKHLGLSVCNEKPVGNHSFKLVLNCTDLQPVGALLSLDWFHPHLPPWLSHLKQASCHFLSLLLVSEYSVHILSCGCIWWLGMFCAKG